MALAPTLTTPTRTRLRTRRAAAVVLAGLAALAVWVVAVPVLDIALVVAQPDGATWTVGPGSVLGAGLVTSLAGWALLALLERLTARGPRIWMILALLMALVSLVGPFAQATTTGAALALAAMHVVVAAVAIPMLLRGADAARRLRR